MSVHTIAVGRCRCDHARRGKGGPSKIVYDSSAPSVVLRPRHVISVTVDPVINSR